MIPAHPPPPGGRRQTTEHPQAHQRPTEKTAVRRSTQKLTHGHLHLGLDRTFFRGRTIDWHQPSPPDGMGPRPLGRRCVGRARSTRCPSCPPWHGSQHCSRSTHFLVASVAAAASPRLPAKWGQRRHNIRGDILFRFQRGFSRTVQTFVGIGRRLSAFHRRRKSAAPTRRTASAALLSPSGELTERRSWRCVHTVTAAFARGAAAFLPLAGRLSGAHGL